MALNFKKFWKGLKLVPKAASESDSQGDIEVLSTDGKARFHNGTSNSPLVTEAHTATLTNKSLTDSSVTFTDAADPTIQVKVDAAGTTGTSTTLTSSQTVNRTLTLPDATDTLIGKATTDTLTNKTFDANGAGNVLSNVETADLAAGVLNISSTLAGATDTQVPSALAAKTYTDTVQTNLTNHITNITDAHDASAISITAIPTIVATDVQAALTELQSDISTVGSDLGAHIVDAVDAHDASAISNVPAGTIAATDVQAAINELDGDIQAHITDIAGAHAASAISNTPSGNLAATDVQGALNELQSDIDTRVASSGGTLTNGSIITPTRLDVKQDTKANLMTYASTASNGQLVFATDEKKMYQVVDSALTEVGGGAGGINYILNPDAENDTTGWATYADAAGVAPVDGTGGVANVTFTRSTVSPLRDTASFLFSKDAVNRQGEGFSYDFTIDSADQAKILRISFDYTTTTNYVDGDVRVYIYDVTNAQVIELVQRDLYGSSFGSYVGEFQANSNSTSYRLIGHISSTSALAYDVKLDNIVVGPSIKVFGPVVTDWQSFTPTGTWVANTTYTGKWRRVGDVAEYQVLLTLAGAPTATALTINLAPTHVIDTTKMNSTASFLTILGHGEANDSAASLYKLAALYGSTTAVAVYVEDASATSVRNATVNQTVPFTFGAGDLIAISFKVPIQGWSSNVTLSEDAGNRVVSSRATSATNAGITTDTVVIYPTEEYDYASAYNTSTGQYTVPESGLYRVGASISATVNITSGQQVNCSIFLDSTEKARTRQFGGNNNTWAVPVDAEFYATKGQIITVKAFSDVSMTLNGNASGNFFTVSKLSSPQTIGASEKVYVRAVQSSGQNIPNTTNTTITWDTAKTIDTHGALNSVTGVFTAPESSYYAVTGHISLISTAVTATLFLYLYKNGVQYTISQLTIPTVANNYTIELNDLVQLAKGDTLYLQASHNTGGTRTLVANAVYNYFTISKVGN